MSVKLRLARTLALAETSRLLLTPPSRPTSAPLRLLGEASTPGWTDRYQPTGALRSARDHSIVMLNLLQKSYHTPIEPFRFSSNIPHNTNLLTQTIIIARYNHDSNDAAW